MVEKDFKLVGFSNFVRQKPKSDRFRVKRFHHIEFWCTDAINPANRFSWGLSMPIVAKFNLSTGNQVHASYLLRSGNFNLLFTAPYSPPISNTDNLAQTATIPTLSHSAVASFAATHGLAVRAIAIEVEDAVAAEEEEEEGEEEGKGGGGEVTVMAYFSFFTITTLKGYFRPKKS